MLRELSERYLHELLRPDPSHFWDRQNVGRLLAEGHNRLASPLYSIVFIMIALCAVFLGNFNRRGNSWRIIVAMGTGLLVRLAGFGIQSIASKTPSLIVLQYVAPLIAIAACAYLLFGGNTVPQALNKFRFANRFMQTAESS